MATSLRTPAFPSCSSAWTDRRRGSARPFRRCFYVQEELACHRRCGGHPGRGLAPGQQPGTAVRKDSPRIQRGSRRTNRSTGCPRQTTFINETNGKEEGECSFTFSLQKVVSIPVPRFRTGQ